MDKLLKILFNLVFSIVQAMVGGVVLSKFWAWFINPKFTSAPTLNYLDCVGVMLVVGFLLLDLRVSVAQVDARLKPKDEDDVTLSIIRNVAMIFVVYPIMLLVGFIWRQFIGR